MKACSNNQVYNSFVELKRLQIYVQQCRTHRYRYHYLQQLRLRRGLPFRQDQELLVHVKILRAQCHRPHHFSATYRPQPRRRLLVSVHYQPTEIFQPKTKMNEVIGHACAKVAVFIITLINIFVKNVLHSVVVAIQLKHRPEMK